MMTALYILAALAFGFVLGDLRGTKQANEILDHNMRELFKAMADERDMRLDDEPEERRPTLH